MLQLFAIFWYKLQIFSSSATVHSILNVGKSEEGLNEDYKGTPSGRIGDPFVTCSKNYQP